MDHTIFTVKDKIFQQTKGLSMGGFLSASLACIFSMWSEHQNKKIWRDSKPPSISSRFRDDTLIIIAKQLSKNEIENYRKMWEDIWEQNTYHLRRLFL